MYQRIFALLIIFISVAVFASSGKINPTKENNRTVVEASTYLSIEKASPENVYTPESTPNKKRDGGVAALVIVGLIFFWFGLSLMILSGILALLLLGGLVWFLIGLLLFILGIIFWSIARQKHRENRRNRRREKIRRRRRRS